MKNSESSYDLMSEIDEDILLGCMTDILPEPI